jgi:hypothetical protein
MVGYAARYGHQPLLLMLGPLTTQQLSDFNDGLAFWMSKENESGGGLQNRIATGG